MIIVIITIIIRPTCGRKFFTCRLLVFPTLHAACTFKGHIQQPNNAPFIISRLRFYVLLYKRFEDYTVVITIISLCAHTCCRHDLRVRRVAFSYFVIAGRDVSRPFSSVRHSPSVIGSILRLFRHHSKYPNAAAAAIIKLVRRLATRYGFVCRKRFDVYWHVRQNKTRISPI